MRVYKTSVAVPALTAFPGVRITLPVHPITGGPLFGNQMIVTATPFGAPPGGLPHFATVSGQGATALFVDVMVWDLGGGPAAADDTVDVHILGY